MTARATARWIESVSWAFALLGLALPVAASTRAFSPWRQTLFAWAYGAPAIPETDAGLLGLMLGITGGSIAGKWIVHAMIARGPLAEGRAWARRATLAGLAAWFLVDSAASLALGAAFNVAMINLMPIVLVGVPLAIGWRGFAATGPSRPEASGLARACFWTSVFGASTGVAIAIGGATPLFGTWFTALEASHYGGAPITEPARQLALFFFGPIGGCTIAQFAMLAALARHEPDRLRSALAGAVSILAWFSIDSGYGLAHDGLFNIAMVNVPAVLATLPPWLLLAARLRGRRSGRAARAVVRSSPRP